MTGGASCYGNAWMRLRLRSVEISIAVGSIVTGDDWQKMLKVAAKFHNYSFNNQLLIYLQRPDATHIAGFRRWQELGRRVTNGEKGIAIFAPCRYKTKIETDDGEEQNSESIRGFRVVYVFDTLSRDCEGIWAMPSPLGPVLNVRRDAVLWSPRRPVLD